VIYELTYGRSLIEFQPTLNLATQVGEVRVVSHHQENKEKITYTAKRKPIMINGQTRFAKALKRQEVVNKPVESKEEARQLATETLQRITRETITGTGSTVGLPDLRAGHMLKISGLDDLFTGLYFVTATTHTISDGGYTTQFECRREDL
jgi:phage protein D